MQMLSFGQRLKLIRKEAQITQAELSEKLMVSVQAVSKWECDNSMPDISQIVPLAAILGVTTDCLLGVGGDEKADREKLEQEITNIIENKVYRLYEQEKHPEYISYYMCREHLKKYPLDYDVKYQCAYHIYCFLWDARRYNFDLDLKEEESLYNEAINLLTSIINYDRDITRILDSKVSLIRLYVYKEEYAKAEAIAEGMPDTGNLRALSEIEIYSRKNDQEKCLQISKGVCSVAENEYMWSLWLRARRISIFGNERKVEAIAAWKDLLESAKFNYKRFEDVDTQSNYWWYVALIHLSNDYIALSEFDKAFEIIEELTDTLVTHYNELKEHGDLAMAKVTKNKFEEYLHNCYNWCFPTEDNIIARDPRFKKCETLLKSVD